MVQLSSIIPEQIEYITLGSMHARVYSVVSVMLDLLWPHELSPTRLLCLCVSAGKNTGVVCHALLRGILPTQGLNLHLCTTGRFFTAEPLGKPLYEAYILFYYLDRTTELYLSSLARCLGMIWTFLHSHPPHRNFPEISHWLTCLTKKC